MSVEVIIRRKSGAVRIVRAGDTAVSGTVLGVMVDGSYYGEADAAILDAIRNRPPVGRWQRLREQLGLSQVQLAERLGCTPAAVSAWEKRGSEPRAEYRQKMLSLC